MFPAMEIEKGLQSLSLSRNRTPGSRNVKGLGLDRVLTFWMKAMLISIANPYLVQARVTGSALHGYGADCSHLSLRNHFGLRCKRQRGLSELRFVKERRILVCDH